MFNCGGLSFPISRGFGGGGREAFLSMMSNHWIGLDREKKEKKRKKERERWAAAAAIGIRFHPFLRLTLHPALQFVT